jgi:hypothetical protein
MVTGLLGRASALPARILRGRDETGPSEGESAEEAAGGSPDDVETEVVLDEGRRLGRWKRGPHLLRDKGTLLAMEIASLPPDAADLQGPFLGDPSHAEDLGARSTRTLRVDVHRG